MSESNHSGKKYLRQIQLVDGCVDVYAVLDAFGVTCPARQHAIKKLLCAGIRGKGDAGQDLHEARDAVSRAIDMEEVRGGHPGSLSAEERAYWLARVKASGAFDR